MLAVPCFETASAALEAEAALIAHELSDEDHGFRVAVEEMDCEAVMMTAESTARVVGALAAVPNGVFEMNRKIDGLVEYSRNLGVVRTEGETVVLTFASRSGLESRLDASTRELDALSRILNGETRHYNRYPGWEFAPRSVLRDAYVKAYREITGEDAIVNVIHAGLECGVIYSHIPDMDIISIAPTLHDLHSPDESLELASVEVFWNTIVRLLEIL